MSMDQKYFPYDDQLLKGNSSTQGISDSHIDNAIIKNGLCVASITNKVPKIDEKDTAIKRRIRIIEFQNN